MNKLWIALTTALNLYLAGAANAQVRPSDPIASPVPTYAVEGLVLGSRVKLDSSMYREYKCAPSEQFDGFTWCQKTRQERERRGSFEALYSILHSKDGTVVYANRSQQPAFFDGNERDRDIQNYSRKIGESPQITRMPRRSGTLDAILATWGKVELEPLDDDSVKLLAEGKSPKKGFLIDFLSNFTRSAQEGLPIYRLIGGAGFVWVASFDQKGRGTLRFAAIDASALQSGPVAAQPANVPQYPVKPPQYDDQQPSQSGVELAAALKAKEDAEAVVAKLRAELSTADKEKTDAEVARAEAQKLAQEARREAEIARKEFEAATSDANVAKDELEKLKASGGTSASYVKEAILIGAFTALILFLAMWAFSRMLGPSPKEAAVPGKTDGDLEVRKDHVEGALVPLSAASVSSAEPESSIDQDDLVKQLAKTLGVEESGAPLTANLPADTDDDQPPIERQEQAAANNPDEKQSMPTKKLPDGSEVFSSHQDDGRDISQSSVPTAPNAGESEEVKLT